MQKTGKIQLNNLFKAKPMKALACLLVITHIFVFVIQDASFAMSSGSSDVGSGLSKGGAQANAIQSFQADLFTGRATTAIPIFIPPGRKGMQPSLGLGYSSGGGNGWLGVGWMLELGSIQRSTKFGRVDYSKDEYVFNFQGVNSELVKIAEGEYRAKSEALFLKFIYDGTTWTIYDKSGTKYTFGSSAESRGEAPGGTFQWRFDKALDTNGNYLDIRYIKDSGQLYPSKIRYTGNENTGDEPKSTVEFILEDRNDIISTYMTGEEIRTAKRLRAIEVRVGGAAARKYVFNYKYSDRTGRSLLEEALQYGSNFDAAAVPLPAITYTYQDSNVREYSHSVRKGNLGDNRWNIQSVAADLFHENLPILLPDGRFTSGQAVSFGEKSNAQSGTQSVTWNQDPNGNITIRGGKDTQFHIWTYVYVSSDTNVSMPSGGDCVPSIFVNGRYTAFSSFSLKRGYNVIEITGYNQNDSYTFRLNYPLAEHASLMSSEQFIKPNLAGDFNGDGITDLATFDAVNGKFTVSLSTGAAFSGGTAWLSGLGDEKSVPLLGDYNSDGKTDICIYDSDSGSWKVALSNGLDKFEAQGEWLTDFAKGDDKKPFVGDFNGDGTLDAGSFDRPNGTWEVALGTKDGFAAPAQWLASFGADTQALTGDFNGDGLTDILSFDKDAGTWKVALSDGKGFVDEGTWADGFAADKDPVVIDYNNDGKADIGYYDGKAGKLTAKVTEFDTSVGSFTFNKEYIWVDDFTLKEDDLTFQPGDYNGDGAIDPAVFNQFTNDRELAISKNAKMADLLTAIDNGRGGKTTIAYRPSHPIQAVTSFGTASRSPDVVSAFAVENRIFNLPFTSRLTTAPADLTHNPLHRMPDPNNRIRLPARRVSTSPPDSEGIAALTSEDADTSALAVLPFVLPVVDTVTTSDGLGHSYIQRYTFAGGLFDPIDREFRGFRQAFIFDKEQNVSETIFLQDDIYKGKVWEQESRDRYGNVYTHSESIWDMSKPYGDTADSQFVFIKQQDEFLYDGDDTVKHTRSAFEYDRYGNLTKAASYGDIDDDSDDKTSETAYAYDETAYILNKPSRTALYNADNSKVSERKFKYDTKGNLTEEEDWLDTGGSNPVTRMAYDEYGNLKAVTDARGYSTTNEYDPLQHIYLAKVTNARGHTTTFEYDQRIGQIISTTDANGNTSRKAYDEFGRITKEISPLDSDEYPTIEYIYDLSKAPNRVITKTRIEHGKPGVITVYSFADGLGRNIQTRSPAEDTSKQIVTGTIEFDDRGQIQYEYMPYFDEFSSGYKPPDASRPRLEYLYDPVGRKLETKYPDGTSSRTVYSDWTREERDPNNHKKLYINDAYGRLIEVHEFNDDEEYITRYEYDGLDNLIKTIDDLGNITRIYYDSLGRKTAMDDPDMGRWEYKYDANGNLITQLDAKGQILKFEYDELNRLVKKSGAPSKGATAEVIAAYTYDTSDDPTAVNTIGRLCKVEDNSGTSRFFYDELGRTIKETKELDGRDYAVERTYDALGRPVTVTYPDGDILKYEYNRQGDVEKILLNGTEYVSDVDYNPAGQLTFIKYGNGTETDYTYNPQNLRLERLITQNSLGEKLQDLSYTFDNVGNVKNITDAVRPQESRSFTYDGLDRLTLATGGDYDVLEYQYNSIGNIIAKDSYRPGEGGSHKYTYTYGGNGALRSEGGQAGPHAVTSRSDGFKARYDENGNMIERLSVGGVGVSPDRKERSIFTYDYENRLVEAVTDSSENVTVDIELKPGWNFLSLPVEPDDLSISSVLSSIEGKYGQVSRFNPQTGAFEHYVKDSLFDDFDTFQLGRGYQLYITSPTPVTLKITGRRFSKENESITLKAGYNLIGIPRAGDVSVSKGLTNLTQGVDYDKILEYNGTTYVELSESDTLKAGRSYYIHCLKEVEWNLPYSKTTFVYDGDGGRVKKVTDRGTTLYLGKSFEVTGSLISKYIFLGGNRIASIQKNSQDASTRVRFYHSDHLGSSNVVTDEEGRLAQLLEYTPFGLTSHQEGEEPTKYRFTSKEFDDTTSLYYYGARYYDPELGRFITADPTIQHPYDPQDFNRYTYARNNPVKYIDPTGLGFLDFLGNIIGAIIGIFVGITTGSFALGFQAYTAVSGMINTATAIAQGANPLRVIGATVASIGLNSILPGAGTYSNLLLQVGVHALRGAIIGGVSSLIGGGRFSEGAKWGAIAGAAIGFATSQQFTNFRTGYGFKSNNDVIESLARQGRFQEAIDFASKRYNLPRGKWSPDDPVFRKGSGVVAYTDMTTGEIKYGPLAFSERSMLQAAGFHEGIHVSQFKSNQVIWDYSRPDPIVNRYALEIDASRQTIKNAWKLDLTRNVVQGEIDYYNYNARLGGFSEWGK